MLKRLLTAFRARRVLVKGAGRLAEGEARTVDVGDPLAGGLQVVIARKGGRLFALDTECPHGQGGRIVGGPLVEGRDVVCPLYGYRFDVETGRPWTEVCRKARTLRVEEKGEDAELLI